jgi:hypothetical protein
MQARQVVGAENHTNKDNYVVSTRLEESKKERVREGRAYVDTASAHKHPDRD